MRRYETIFILDPDLSEDDRNALFERLKDLILQSDGLPVEVDEWGARKLAYEIKKKPRGYYVRFDYCGTGALVGELERQARIDDRFMKYMTIQLEDDADVEAIREELAKQQEELEAKAQEEKAAQEAKLAKEAASEPVEAPVKKEAPEPVEAPAEEEASEPVKAPRTRQ